MKRQHDIAVWASLVAAKFAQAIGLKPGNAWEPAIARYLDQQRRSGADPGLLEAQMALQLGIVSARQSAERTEP